MITAIGAITFTGAESGASGPQAELVDAEPVAMPDAEITYVNPYGDYFAINTGVSYDFLVEAVNNDFVAVPDKPLTASSKGITLELSHYVFVAEHVRFVFKISGMEHGNVKPREHAGMGNIVDKLVLSDETGKKIYDSEHAKTEPSLGMINDIYKITDDVFLEIVLDHPDNDSGMVFNLRIPETLIIEIDGISGAEDGQWKFEFPVDEKFTNVEPLFYEASDPVYCDEIGVYVDSFYSSANAARMELIIDENKNSVEQPAGDWGFALFQDPVTHSYKIPYEQKLFVEVNGDQLFETTEVYYNGVRSDSMSKYNGEWYWREQTDKGTKYYLYLPTLYFADADELVVRVLDEDRKPIEIKLHRTKNQSDAYQSHILRIEDVLVTGS